MDSSAAPGARAPKRRAAASPQEPLRRYGNVHLVLRKRILAGEYPRNSLLAGERDLAAEFGVARVTVRSALEALAREGLVRRESRRGTIVTGAPAPAARGQAVDAFESLFGSMLGMAHRTRARVLAFEAVAAPADVARALGIAEGEPVQRIVRMRLAGSGPISYTTAFVPAALAAGIRRQDLAAKPLLDLLEAKGLRIDRSEESVGATQADLEVAAALAVPVGTALLRVTRTIRDASGRAFEHFEGLFRPERYEYRLVVARDPGQTRIQVSAAIG